MGADDSTQPKKQSLLRPIDRTQHRSPLSFTGVGPDKPDENRRHPALNSPPTLDDRNAIYPYNNPTAARSIKTTQRIHHQTYRLTFLNPASDNESSLAHSRTTILHPLVCPYSFAPSLPRPPSQLQTCPLYINDPTRATATATCHPARIRLACPPARTSFYIYPYPVAGHYTSARAHVRAYMRVVAAAAGM